MKKIALAALLILLLAGQAWGATIYAIEGYYKSGAASCAEVTSADTAGSLQAALLAAGSGGTLYICPGTYSGTELNSSGGAVTAWNTANTIIGVGGRENVIIDGTDLLAAPFTINSNNVTLQGLTVKNAGAAYYGVAHTSGTGGTMRNLVIGPNAGTGASINENMSIDRCLFVENAGSTFGALRVNGATGHSITNSVFRNNGVGMYFIRGGTTTVKNVIISGSTSYSIRSGDNDKTVNFYNCAIVNGMTGDGGLPVITSSIGTLNFYSSLLLPNSLKAIHFWTETGTGTVNIDSSCVYDSPKFSSMRRPGIVAFVFDDTEVLDQLENTVAGINVPVTFAVNTALATSSNLWARIQALVDAGHDIASHSVNHVDLTAQTPEVLASELVDSKAAIEANLTGFTCRLLVNPYNYTNTDVEDAAKAAGYIAATTHLPFTSMESINIYSLQRLLGHQQMGGTGTAIATIERNARAMAEYAGWLGGLHIFYGHDATYPVNEWTAAEWIAAINAIEASGVTVMTVADAIEYITESGLWADSGDGKTWTRTFADEEDLQLQSDSPLINAGTTAATASFTETQTDYFGHEYFFAPYDRLNIGADQAGSDAAKRPTGGGVLWR